jgi:hypothetical protein
MNNSRFASRSIGDRKRTKTSILVRVVLVVLVVVVVNAVKDMVTTMPDVVRLGTGVVVLAA